MTNEEIQKLLGGYATNSLTDAERKALFEAALDDQELFDSLQREQTLKDILDDPVTRRQVREALEASALSAATPSWWVRWSTWGFAAGALAAVLAVAVIFKTDRTATQQPSFEIARADRPVPVEVQPPRAVELKAPETRPLRRSEKKAALQDHFATDADGKPLKEAPEKQVAAAAPPAPPPPPAVATLQVQSQAVSQQQAVSDQEQVKSTNVRNALRDETNRLPASASPRQALTAGSAIGGLTGAPLLTYSVLKLDQNGSYSLTGPNVALHEGDAVRINAVPLTSGYLALYERDSAGNWRQLFPASGPGIKVIPNRTYMLPDSSIDLKADQRLRLVLSPGANEKGPPASVDITLRLQ